MAVNPFDALGLPARPDLSDEQVRAAWRKIAAATHPDRPGGGDVARYTAATAAYAVLRTPWGRSEAFADLGATFDDTSPLPACAAGRRWRRPGARRPAVPIRPAVPASSAGGPDRRRRPAARPDPARPPAAPGHPRAWPPRCCLPGRAAPDPRPARRAGAGHRPDHLVPAHRPLRPGPAAVMARTRSLPRPSLARNRLISPHTRQRARRLHPLDGEVAVHLCHPPHELEVTFN